MTRVCLSSNDLVDLLQGKVVKAMGVELVYEGDDVQAVSCAALTAAAVASSLTAALTAAADSASSVTTGKLTTSGLTMRKMGP